MENILLFYIFGQILNETFLECTILKFLSI